jgi:hypothetical protein
MVHGYDAFENHQSSVAKLTIKIIPGKLCNSDVSSLPGGLTASGHPGGTYPGVSRSTMRQ